MTGGIATEVIVAGNITEDWQPGGHWSPGGPSLYSARMAQALGARVVLVTGIHPGYDRTVLAGLDVHAVAAASNPRYANDYDSFGNRTQVLLDEGVSLHDVSWADVSPPDVLILAPAYHELAACPSVNGRVTGISLQGPLRTVDADGGVHPAEDAARIARPFAAPGHFLFFSEEDTHRPESLAELLVQHGSTAVLTRGYRGATVYTRDGADPHAAIPTVRMVDPTGAGDCFSTAFIVRYAETGELRAAIRFALTAGALAVEGEGIEGIPTRAAIEDRLRQVAA